MENRIQINGVWYKREKPETPKYEINDINVTKHLSYIFESTDFCFEAIRIYRGGGEVFFDDIDIKFTDKRVIPWKIDYWDNQILNLGTSIQNERLDFFERIKNPLQSYIQKLNRDDKEITLNYKINLMNKERLDSHKDIEIAAKTTLIGPHRDDFEIVFNNKDIAYFGSRGQQRTALLALKLAEIEFIEQKTGEKPLLLLDDVFSELDSKHKDTVIEAIKDQQTIITSTEKPNLMVDSIIEI